jgi:hypothetical protein
VSQDVKLLLAVLLFLQLKHFICDFILQTPYQFLNKGKYGHPGGIIHAGMHALASIPIFFLIPVGFPVAIGIVAGEFIAHYHIDWTKEQTVKRKRWKFPQAEYWWTFGADQGMHQLTYLAMAAILASVAGL